MQDDFGNRMKDYEMVEAGRKLIPLLPVVARIDGRSFSKFTVGMKRPYDEGMSKLMIETTKYLVKETNANCGYTQSDEISLAWYSDRYDREIIFDGRISKMTSTLAALATAFFNHNLKNYLPSRHAEKMPTFDCRVWNLPNLTEAANVFLWREQDAMKNSVSMAARHYYSHNELMNKNTLEMKEMLRQKGVDWNDYPDFFKRGTYIQRKKSVRPFTYEEFVNLPEKHAARLNPNLEIERTDYVEVKMPEARGISNRKDVIFFGAEPSLVSFLHDD